ncbi:hypothetical protein EVAR_24757_1 [Eumeta japonica]|uniref:Uncharacterized protein n=1 Tax=Eumeta variegata TaxID=151549 RepID=A0A4C1VFL1_EUMVA|nr:hypothetical protein EVAR_24757_1 [Eumeta japonica]
MALRASDELDYAQVRPRAGMRPARGVESCTRRDFRGPAPLGRSSPAALPARRFVDAIWRGDTTLTQYRREVTSSAVTFSLGMGVSIDHSISPLPSFDILFLFKKPLTHEGIAWDCDCRWAAMTIYSGGSQVHLVLENII